MDHEVTLPQLTRITQELTLKLIESGGEITPEIDALLEIKSMEPAKIDGYNAIIDRTEVEEDYHKKQSQAHSRIASSFKRLREKLKSNLKYHMQVLGLGEISGNDSRFVLSPCKEKLVIDETRLPPEWKIAVTTYHPDKERIEAALKSGQVIPGCSFEGGFALRKYLGSKK